MKIFDKYFYLFGHEIHLRFLPKKFRNDLLEIKLMINNEDYAGAERAVKVAFEKWGYDREIANLEERVYNLMDY